MALLLNGSVTFGTLYTIITKRNRNKQILKITSALFVFLRSTIKIQAVPKNVLRDQSEVGSIDCEIQPEKGMYFFCFLLV